MMKLTNKVYNELKWTVLIFLPALTTFIGTVGQAFEWKGLSATLVLLTAFTTFLGTLIGVSSANYKKEE